VLRISAYRRVSIVMLLLLMLMAEVQLFLLSSSAYRDSPISVHCELIIRAKGFRNSNFITSSSSSTIHRFSVIVGLPNALLCCQLSCVYLHNFIYLISFNFLLLFSLFFNFFSQDIGIVVGLFRYNTKRFFLLLLLLLLLLLCCCLFLLRLFNIDKF